ncbi:MAG: hypothetical protein J6K55_00460 [Clostridia bacterium]|nr:hypothetical protein [Clostridia bacterium]
MKRNWKLLLCLLMALLMLNACSSQPDPNDFPDITQAIGPTGTPAPTAVSVPESAPQDNADGTASGESIFSANPYDVMVDEEMLANMAASEEDYVDPEYGVESLYEASLKAEGTVYPYAGSTPIPLNPIDMPTPTPRPDLSFTYADYTASTVGVTFKAPVSWQVDQSYSGIFILSEPVNQIKDNQQCIITVSAEPVNATYKQSDLETHVKQRLNTIGGLDFDEWKPSLTATRYMMGSEGVYANYSGTLTDGTEVGGRIHYVSIDKTLYGLEIQFPLGFKGDFIDVFGEIRSSMKQIQ